MKIFNFFVVENLMVAGLPLCETNSVRYPFGDATLISVTCRQPFRNLSYSTRVSANTPDIEPPMIEEVHLSKVKPIQSEIEPEKPSPPCQCPDVLWESSDSSDGTGDHEAFE